MRLALTFSLCALLSVSPVMAAPVVSGDVEAATPARAADSCGWSAQTEEDEGGPVMVALSCDSDTEFSPAFSLQCGGDINIRYTSLETGAEPPASSSLILTSDGTSLSADVVLEEMDGAFAAYVELGSPIIALLKTGVEVGVTVKGVICHPEWYLSTAAPPLSTRLSSLAQRTTPGSNAGTSVFVS